MALTALVFVLALAPAQEPSGYRSPSPDVVAIVDAPVPPELRLSPDGSWILFRYRAPLPRLSDLARPWLPLAGLRVDPATSARWRSQYASALTLRPVAGGEERTLVLRDGEKPREGAIRFSATSWSQTSRRLAFTVATAEGTELWTAPVEGEPALLAPRVSAIFGDDFQWMPDGRRIVYLAVPEDRGDAPTRPVVPTGPSIQESAGLMSPVRTYQDLLSGEHDERLFDHFATAQIVIVDTEDGRRETVGQVGRIERVVPSPDGSHLLVERLERPFSYTLPYWRFPRVLEVWDLSGHVETVLARVPLGESIPIDGVRTGPRRVDWQATAPATLVWVEALDGGDPRTEAAHRDRWMRLAAPFDGEPEEGPRIEHRAAGVSWLEEPGLAFVSEYDRERRWIRTVLVHFGDPEFETRILDDRSVRDRYGDPGDFARVVTPRGTSVVRQDGPFVYRLGSGASPQGDRPFLARQNLETLRTERLWRSSPGSFESIVAVIRSGTEREPSFVTRYETPDDPPNFRLRDLADETVRTLTEFPHPYPGLMGAKKQLLTYAREDGVALSGTLHTPPDYDGGRRLPVLVWAYPREFTEPSTAGQVRGSPFRFTRPLGASPLALLKRGYAVLDGASMPVVGDPETVNDTFIEQIVSAAQAALDAAAATGFVDPSRAAVGGHSYGAFMAANLLAHSDLFRAGIARSGAYNRTLTPFGFQAERRTLWEAPELYFRVSPFLHADRIDEPLLLLHGEKDPNPGTYPMQSARLFSAIKGSGGIVRFVELPLEGHGYRARESVLHSLAEMIEWCDRFLGPSAPVEAGHSESATGADED